MEECIDANSINPEKDQVHDIIQSIFEDIAEEVRVLNHLYAFTPNLVGSGKEKTRPYLPNEFDYHLICTEIRRFVDIIYTQTNISENMVLVKQELAHKLPSHLYDHYGHFIMDELRSELDVLIHKVLPGIMTSEKYKNKLNLETSFLDDKEISCLRVTWRGRSYKDMPIYIDLVVALEINSYKCLSDVFREPHASYVDQSRYFVFNKGLAAIGYFIAFSDTEQRLMRSLPASARLGFMFAKAIRLGDLFDQEIYTKMHHVRNLEDFLRTYILKTCLFYCAIFLKRTHLDLYESLVPIEWTYLIFKQVEQGLVQGCIISIFSWNIYKEGHAVLFHCPESVDTPDDEKKACCFDRADLLVITRQLIGVVKLVCEEREINLDRADQIIQECASKAYLRYSLDPNFQQGKHYPG